MDYQRFDEETFSVELHPYFVKEFHNRWYVVGYLADKNVMRTYALDRIQQIRPCTSDYIPNTTIDAEEYFKDCIGINFMERVIKRFVPSFSQSQGNYVKTQHLHRSQNIIKDEPDELIVELDLIVNHELKMLILSFGDQVRVLEPVWLADDIAKICRCAARAYRKRTPR